MCIRDRAQTEQALSEKDTQLTDTQTQLTDTQTQLTDAQNQLATLNSQLETARTAAANLRNELNLSEGQPYPSEELKAVYDFIEKQSALLDEEFASLEEKVAALRVQLEAGGQALDAPVKQALEDAERQLNRFERAVLNYSA